MKLNLKIIVKALVLIFFRHSLWIMKAKFRFTVPMRGLVEPTGLPVYLNNENLANAIDPRRLLNAPDRKSDSELIISNIFKYLGHFTSSDINTLKLKRFENKSILPRGGCF